LAQLVVSDVHARRMVLNDLPVWNILGLQVIVLSDTVYLGHLTLVFFYDGLTGDRQPSVQCISNVILVAAKDN